MREKLRSAAAILGDLLRLRLETFDEQAADRLALDLGVLDAFERVQKELLRLHMPQRDIVVVAKEGHDLLGLALA